MFILSVGFSLNKVFFLFWKLFSTNKIIQKCVLFERAEWRSKYYDGCKQRWTCWRHCRRWRRKIQLLRMWVPIFISFSSESSRNSINSKDEEKWNSSNHSSTGDRLAGNVRLVQQSLNLYSQWYRIAQFTIHRSPFTLYVHMWLFRRFWILIKPNFGLHDFPFSAGLRWKNSVQQPTVNKTMRSNGNSFRGRASEIGFVSISSVNIACSLEYLLKWLWESGNIKLHSCIENFTIEQLPIAYRDIFVRFFYSTIDFIQYSMFSLHAKAIFLPCILRMFVWNGENVQFQPCALCVFRSNPWL